MQYDEALKALTDSKANLDRAKDLFEKSEPGVEVIEKMARLQEEIIADIAEVKRAEGKTVVEVSSEADRGILANSLVQSLRGQGRGGFMETFKANLREEIQFKLLSDFEPLQIQTIDITPFAFGEPVEEWFERSYGQRELWHWVAFDNAKDAMNFKLAMMDKL